MHDLGQRIGSFGDSPARPHEFAASGRRRATRENTSPSMSIAQEYIRKGGRWRSTDPSELDRIVVSRTRRVGQAIHALRDSPKRVSQPATPLKTKQVPNSEMCAPWGQTDPTASAPCAPSDRAAAPTRSPECA